MTIDLAAYPEVAKYLQDLQFGTLAHTNTYNALRQSQEGFHGYAKDQGYEKLDAAGLRRVHGLAAHFVMTAVLVAAAGIRKVKAFLATARLDEDGDLCVRRRKRKGEHAPTFLPPGSKGTRGDPDYDAQPEAA